MSRRAVIRVAAFGFLIGSLPVIARAGITKGPYLQNVSTDGITVMWESDTSPAGAVEYGLTPAYGSSAGSLPFLSLCGTYLHEVVLSGLAAGSYYYYRVEDGDLSSSASSFQVPAEEFTAFTFAAYGDSRSGRPAHFTRHSRVIGAILEGDLPDLVINLGDAVEAGDFCAETGFFGWGKEYYSPGHALFEKVPGYVAIGNHEYDDSGNPAYFQDYFSFPDNPPADPADRDLWYSFDYGNTHFTVINTNYYEVGGGYWPGSDQYQWLEDDLKDSVAVWKVVAFHHPPYASYPRDRSKMREYLVPLFERYGVQLVLNGHDHFYERSRKRGVYYIVTGGGGAPLYLPDHPELNPYRIFADSRYHFCRAGIEGGSLIFAAVDTQSSVFDSFRLNLNDDEDGDGYLSGDEFLYSWDPSSPYSPRPGWVNSGDYDGDGTDEITLFRPSVGLWASRGMSRFYFGGQSDLPVPADFFGDGTAAIGVFRPSSGLWAVEGKTRFYFGENGDLPVPGDYGGTDSVSAALFRPFAGLWMLRGASRVYFGSTGDRPVPGDYDGNGFDDISLFRPSTGLWAVRGMSRFYFGAAGDLPLLIDENGDGTVSPAIYRSSAGLWAVRGVTRIYFGDWADYPVPADYDGEGGDEIAVFRPATGFWAVRGWTRVYYGDENDAPATR